MTLGTYFAAESEHEQLAWMAGSALEILVDSAVSGGRVLIMRNDATPGGLEQAFREAGWDKRTPPPEGWAPAPAPWPRPWPRRGAPSWARRRPARPAIPSPADPSPAARRP